MSRDQYPFVFVERVEIHVHGDPEVRAELGKIADSICSVRKEFTMLSQEVQDVLDQVTAVKTQDAAIVKLVQQLAGKIEANIDDKAALRQMASDLRTEASTVADAVVANTPADTTGGGSTGGSTGASALGASFPDRASFDAAVGAYTGPEAIVLDGTQIRDGDPRLDYFSHSADGSVNDTGPTD